jgi:hypothetical protein
MVPCHQGWSVTLKMEALRSSKMLVSSHKTKWCTNQKTAVWTLIAMKRSELICQFLILQNFSAKVIFSLHLWVLTVRNLCDPDSCLWSSDCNRFKAYCHSFQISTVLSCECNVTLCFWKVHTSLWYLQGHCAATVYIWGGEVVHKMSGEEATRGWKQMGWQQRARMVRGQTVAKTSEEDENRKGSHTISYKLRWA